jgi:hypothetical protein
MTLYTIALAGKAYLAQALSFSKIQQTTGSSFTKNMDSNFFGNRLGLELTNSRGAKSKSVRNLLLPFPYSIANQPGLQFRRKATSNKIVAAILQHTKQATNGLKRLILDTENLTTRVDVIVSFFRTGRGNYKLVPVRSAR